MLMDPNMIQQQQRRPGIPYVERSVEQDPQVAQFKREALQRAHDATFGYYTAPQETRFSILVPNFPAHLFS
jgi:hypothetical protein